MASFPANNYGLFDMAGNVDEWCYDWNSNTYYAAGQTDPQGPSSGTHRVLRGGAWLQNANYARCANRDHYIPDGTDYGIGFRCVRGL